MHSEIIGIIPARYASTRLPAKPLADIAGVPMVIRVWQNIISSKYLSRVIIATDDERILNKCAEYGAEAVMTPPELPSGTDRVFYTYNKIYNTINYNSSINNTNKIIVNIQGDEPLLTFNTIDNLLEKFIYSSADVGTIITKISSFDELSSPDCVKVVLDNKNNAMYFSRSPIPYLRDQEISNWHKLYTYWKHIGIYAYKISALKKFVELEQSKYELLEKLEQLRLLETGARFLCVETN